MLWSLIEKAPVRRDSAAFADWLRETLTSEDLAELPDDDVAALSLFALRRSYPPQTAVFTQGRGADSVYIVERGVIALVHEDAVGTVVVQTVRRGALVGDLPVILGIPQAYSAITQQDTTVLELRMDTLRVLVELEPGIYFRLLRLVSQRLAGVERRVLELARRSAFQRLVQLLVRESDEQGSPTVRLTQTQIAGDLGLSRQTVSRALGELERQRLVERRRGRVVIVDADQLQRIASPYVDE